MNMNWNVHLLHSQIHHLEESAFWVAACFSCHNWCPYIPLPAFQCWALAGAMEETERSVLEVLICRQKSLHPRRREKLPQSGATRGTRSTTHPSRAGLGNGSVCPNKYLFSENFIPCFSPLKNAHELPAGKHSDLDQNRKMKRCSLVRKRSRISSLLKNCQWFWLAGITDTTNQPCFNF